jgi:hypothetical protein
VFQRRRKCTGWRPEGRAARSAVGEANSAVAGNPLSPLVSRVPVGRRIRDLVFSRNVRSGRQWHPEEGPSQGIYHSGVSQAGLPPQGSGVGQARSQLPTEPDQLVAGGKPLVH